MPKDQPTEQQDAVQFLQADHRKVEQAFEKYQHLGPRAYVSKKELADEVCQDLLRHTTIEEEIFYPAFRQAVSQADSKANEALVEHQGAKHLIEQIQSMSSEEKLFDAKVKVLSEYIKHHVKEEEEDMFPAIRNSEVDLQALREHLQTRNTELSGQQR